MKSSTLGLVDKAAAWLKTNPAAGRTSLARELNISQRQAQNLLVHLGHVGSHQKAPKKQEASFDESSGEASSIDPNIRTLNGLLQVCKVDLSVWRVKTWWANKWEVAMSTDSGPAKQPLFQIKALLERIPAVVDAKKVQKFFREQLEKLPAKSYVARRFPPLGRTRLLELSVPDLHIGKLAWHPETRHGNYDVEIAVDAYKTAVWKLLSRAPLNSVEQILLPLGNDFFNVDNAASTTAHGTPQDEDGRWQASFMAGATLMTDTIEELSEVAPVKVIVVQGNHDYERAFYLGEYLRAWFRKHRGVEIDNEPSYRKYHQFGEVLLGFTHGDKENPKDLPLLMARERAKEWSSTTYQEWHLGHLHTEKLREIVGVKVRHLPSLTSADAWHAGKGYVGNIRSAEAFLYDKKEGLIATYLHTRNQPSEA